jgi:hypothetical protein
MGSDGDVQQSKVVPHGAGGPPSNFSHVVPMFARPVSEAISMSSPNGPTMESGGQYVPDGTPKHWVVTPVHGAGGPHVSPAPHVSSAALPGTPAIMADEHMVSGGAP